MENVGYIFGRLKSLHLDGGRRDKVEVVALHRRGEIPASLSRPGLDDVVVRPRDNVADFFGAFRVALAFQSAGEEKCG
jgi:hypothetical protein